MLFHSVKNYVGVSTLSLLALSTTSHASVTFYDTLTAFQLVSNSSVVVTFDPFSPTDTNLAPTLTLNGVTFTQGYTSTGTGSTGPNLYVYSPGLPDRNFGVTRTTNVLTVGGNENFDISPASAPFAVGFDTYTNFSLTKPVVTVFDTSNKLLGTYTLTQAADTLGFFGVTSTVPIGKVHWLASQGEVENTGIDNVRISGVATPAPSSLLTMGGGMGFLVMMRRRKTKASA